MDSLTINMIFSYQCTKVQNCEYVPLGLEPKQYVPRVDDQTTFSILLAEGSALQYYLNGIKVAQIYSFVP